jgi:ADP-L-glycero-D-manno-heptose 6-epimerase
MIVVTGAAGFIGCHLVRALVQGGRAVCAVDDRSRSEGLANLAGVPVAQEFSPPAFLSALAQDDPRLRGAEAVLHQGAVTDTLADWQPLLLQNYDYTRRLLELCHARGLRMIYASSAAVYGAAWRPGQVPEEAPCNLYGWSKLLVDQLVRCHLAQDTRNIVGLRYFNVYGPHETHKRHMASQLCQLYQQWRATGRLRLFGASHGMADGEQRRDFVFVEDVVRVNLFFLSHAELSGIYDVGTGQSRSFNQLAQCVLDFCGSGSLEYTPFPSELMDRYQSYTQADLAPLRQVGYCSDFVPLEPGTRQTLRWLHDHS